MGIVLRVNANDKVTLSERANRFLQNLPEVREVSISKEQWAKLSPYMQDKVKKGQAMWVTTT